jgi:hydrogenase nickel incorporation protein HypA/HybF
MHEWALAEGVVQTALDTARDNGLRRVSSIRVKIGQLQQISPDFFRQAIAQVMPPDEPLLAGTSVDITSEAAVCSCRACAAEFGLEQALAQLGAEAAESIHFIPELAPTFLACPTCGSPDYSVLRGRGVWLEAVEGQT